MKGRPLRQKMLTVVMLTTLAALVVSIGAVIAYDLRGYHRAVLGDMATQAELLGHMTSAALSFEDRRLAIENLASLRIRPTVRAAAIYNAGGVLFATYVAPGERADIPPRPEPDSVQVLGNDLEIYRRIVEHGEFLGTVYLRAEYVLVQRALDYLSIAAGVIAVAMLVAYLITRRLGSIITAPIVDISDIAHRVIASRDYSQRAERISDDEAGELVDSFNTMLTEIEQRTRELEASNAEIAGARLEVMRLNEQLEQRVHERTMQLELTNAELELAMETAKKANQAKSAFLSSMSHELRTPLNAVLGFAQILSSDALPATSEQKKQFAGHILKSGRHLLTLINEILDLAKVESGAVTLSLEPVALDDILVECRSMTEPLAEQRSIRVLFPQTTGVVVMADRTRLKQVLLNLLSNAIKYNREHGAVVLACTLDDKEVRISIQDTGLGLRPDQVANLFLPFNRLGQENGAEEGTGIGLVVTRRLVELMGGAIHVTSSAGVGSVFSITMPTTAPLGSPADAAQAPSEAVESPAHEATHTLLYVEDNPANLRLVEDIVSFRPDLKLISA
ncbi:MAG: ATP-binding protein, partial [Gammaproteobacteria bacterium]